MSFKKCYFLLLLFISTLSIAQIETPPTEYSKIHFVYHTTSDYYIDDKGVYADTLLFKIDLPEKKYAITKSPLDSTLVVGFMPKYSFNDEEKKVLNYKMIRYYKTTTVVFDYKKNKSEVTTVFPDFNLIPKNVTDFLGASLSKNSFSSTSFITYKDNYQYKVENKVENTIDSYEKNVVRWIEGKENIGMFDYKLDGVLYKNMLIVDSKLNKHIVPTTLFSNCEYGVTKVDAIPFTVNLIKVSYK